MIILYLSSFILVRHSPLVRLLLMLLGFNASASALTCFDTQSLRTLIMLVRQIQKLEVRPLRPYDL
jgi:hypothetical protein